MMKYAKPLGFVFVMLAFLVTACNDNPFEANQPNVQEFDSPSADAQHTDPRVAGRTIQNIQFVTDDGETFIGRIVNLDFEEVDEAILASGRIIGRLLDAEGNLLEQINQVFEGLDVTGLLDVIGNSEEACQILFLELGPIFLDVLGLVVEIPDPLIVEIRAEPGPGQLLGNLLCALVGLLD